MTSIRTTNPECSKHDLMPAQAVTGLTGTACVRVARSADISRRRTRTPMKGRGGDARRSCPASILIRDPASKRECNISPKPADRVARTEASAVTGRRDGHLFTITGGSIADDRQPAAPREGLGLRLSENAYGLRQITSANVKGGSPAIAAKAQFHAQAGTTGGVRSAVRRGCAIHAGPRCLAGEAATLPPHEFSSRGNGGQGGLQAAPWPRSTRGRCSPRDPISKGRAA